MLLVVQRAHDRALYLYAQAEAARRLPDAELAERRGGQATEAHGEYRRLSREAEHATGRAVMLDVAPAMPTSGQLRFADVDIDVDAGQVRRAGVIIDLTQYEFACLTALAANPSRILTREALQHLVADDKPTLNPRSRTIDVHLARVRSKLGPYYIEAIRGVGYRASTRLASPDADLDSARQRRRTARRAWARGSSASPTPPTATSPVMSRRSSRIDGQ